MKEYTDTELIQGIRSRNEHVFSFLNRRFRRAIILMIYERGGSTFEGEDIYSEGLIDLIKIVEQYDFKLTCKLSSLLYTICNNKWKGILDNKKAAKNYQIRHNEPLVSEDFSEDLDYNLRLKIFWDCFERLGIECRRILKAYFKEIPSREIADLFDYTYANLRKKKSRCHTYLVQLVESHRDYIDIKEEDNL